MVGNLKKNITSNLIGKRLFKIYIFYKRLEISQRSSFLILINFLKVVEKVTEQHLNKVDDLEETYLRNKKGKIDFLYCILISYLNLVSFYPNFIHYVLNTGWYRTHFIRLRTL